MPFRSIFHKPMYLHVWKPDRFLRIVKFDNRARIRARILTAHNSLLSVFVRLAFICWLGPDNNGKSDNIKTVVQ